MLNHQNKIFNSIEALSRQVNQWKEDRERVVFTNGCFDLIHLGHIQYLLEARNLGTRLVVALNSDASVSKIKGKHRPINDEDTRINVMASFYFVDAVITFDDDTPYEYIKRIIPNILVKGGDWPIDQIVGNKIVLDNGGEVRSLSFIDGYSTTKLEQKIITSHQ
jgi:rfaE bifunctional protein nucleotidyltransferase chain/domain